ncbi:hypothetical protein ACLQ3A_10210 [Micromonospora zamorensis]|uniref:hypothetical protein n=1 Tax=Micromonospora zamorensis TaxID=709883 RepID=UPI003CEC5166
MWSWLHERWVRWWWADVAAVVAVTAVCAWTVAPGTGADLMGQLSLADRRNVYTDLLTLTTIFAGFGGVVFAIFIGLQSRSVREIKSQVGEHLLRVWLSALLAPWVSAFAIITAKILDRGGKGSVNEARWIAVAAMSLVALQLLRVLWVFYSLATIDSQDGDPTIPTAAEPARIGKRRPSKQPDSAAMVAQQG